MFALSSSYSFFFLHFVERKRFVSFFFFLTRPSTFLCRKKYSRSKAMGDASHHEMDDRIKGCVPFAVFLTVKRHKKGRLVQQYYKHTYLRD